MAMLSDFFSALLLASDGLPVDAHLGVLSSVRAG